MTAHTRKHANSRLPLPAGRTKVSHIRPEHSLLFSCLKIGWCPAIKQTCGLKNLKCCVNVAVLCVNIIQTAQIH